MMLSRSHLMIGLALNCLATCLFSGCQTTIGGQTLPSAYYLRDDVQYFPSGPETQLPLARQAIEDYKAGQRELNEQIPSMTP
ncbi:hypothetical protein Pan44_30980 [Caulifigura coniformis]|uniref:Uncharacterized protein n=2 Tax=Caulifigura coniformis TaxID=2527983 RepID=A0A517SG55_9PLAN|nr:hypothetical protein Pan44_30980 [Caulifigura coniformis]